jgi:L-lactate dehydrogenase complex protein LldE
MTDSPTDRPRVALFVTCLVDTLYPGVGVAAAELLERHGVDVIFPEQQTCCGQPAYNAGYRTEARAVARHFIDVFWPLIDEGTIDAIVAPSGSCVAMVKLQYPILFQATDEHYWWKAVQLGEVTYELTQYLADFLGVWDTGASFSGKVAYHPCCHLLRGAEIVEPEGADECCGFGGLFSIKNAEISAAMGRRKAHNLTASEADIVALNDVSCMMHLNGILEREGHTCRAVHIAELLNAGHESDAG